MRRRLLNILLGLVLVAPLGAIEIPCGTLIELRATSFEGWHFDHWSDGQTDSIRRIEVRADLQLIAYFEHNCLTYTLPVEALYDWLLMLDVRAIHEAGYFFTIFQDHIPEHITNVTYICTGCHSMDIFQSRNDWRCVHNNREDIY